MPNNSYNVHYPILSYKFHKHWNVFQSMHACSHLGMYHVRYKILSSFLQILKFVKMFFSAKFAPNIKPLNIINRLFTSYTPPATELKIIYSSFSNRNGFRYLRVLLGNTPFSTQWGIHLLFQPTNKTDKMNVSCFRLFLETPFSYPRWFIDRCYKR